MCIAKRERERKRMLSKEKQSYKTNLEKNRLALFITG